MPKYATTVAGIRFEFDTEEELDDIIAKSPDLYKKVREIEQAALAVGVLTAPKNAPAPSGAATAGPPSKDVPRCNHGPMKDLKEKNYAHRWYCSADFKAKDKCDARD